MIYLLTAFGLSPGGSTHLHTNNTQNNTNNNRTTQITNNVEECGPCPLLCEFYPGICLTTEEKARKNLSQCKRNLSRCTVYILPKHPHIKKPTQTHTLQNPIYVHTHTHTHTLQNPHTHTHTHYKTHTNTHITNPPHTHTHTRPL